jgi:protein ImuB
MGGAAMSTAEMYACIYAAEFPAQALLRLRPELHEKPCVVMEGVAPAEQVCACNRLARRLGARPGMTRVEVELLSAVLRLARSKAMEESAAAVLLECASSFSPRVEDRSAGMAFVCAVDIAGTRSLFGDAEVLAQKMYDRIRALGIEARIAVSANLHAALCAVRGMPRAERIAVLPRGQEASMLAPLPVGVLELNAGQAETLSLWGIRTLGMLAALPEDALIARMGQAGKRLRALARGEWPHLLQPVEVPFELVERAAFDAAVELLESLLFVLHAMLDQLLERARSRMSVLAEVTVTLALEGGRSVVSTVRPALPTSDKQLWLKLLQLELEAHPPQAAITGLTVKAEPGTGSKVQMGLFSPQMPEASRLDVTLARLRALVGESNVGHAALENSHAPDRFQVEPFSVTPPAKAAALPVASQPRLTLRQLRPPEAVRVAMRHAQPVEVYFREQRYQVERAYGPWKCDGEWWASTLWGQEQWDVVLRGRHSSMLCACLVHDCLQNAWRMAALYD